MAENITSGLQLYKLGVRLGIETNKVALGKYNNEQLQEATIEILTDWKGRFLSKVKAYEELIRALDKMERKDLIAELESAR